MPPNGVNALDFNGVLPQADRVLHWLAEDAFDDLLLWWREHHRRRLWVEEKRGDGCGGDNAWDQAAHRRWDEAVASLAASRTQLDNARARMHLFRSALHPEATSDATPLRVHFCETLDTIVHLGWQHQHPTRPGNLSCPCGTLVPLHPQ